MGYNDSAMAKVTVRRGETEFVVSDITFEQAKELVGVNGYGSKEPTQTPVKIPLRNDYNGFVRSISDRGRMFLDILRHHPEGIDSHELALKLGFNDARQIGGLTGAGLTRIAKRHGVNAKDIYRVAITFPANKRTVTFYPGKLLTEYEEKPAV